MSSGVIVIAGYGSGISNAVATKFGSKGFKVALLSRTQSKLDPAAADYTKRGITAKGYSVDLSSFDSVKATISRITNELGPVTIVFWNPYGPPKGLLEASEEDIVHEFNLSVTGLIAAVQASYPDLKSQAGTSAVLVTGGAITVENDATAQFTFDIGWTTFATAKVGQRKLVHVMNKGLAKDGIYAAEVTVMSTVKGTGFDPGNSTITPEGVADLFWDTYAKRDLAVWAVPCA